VRPARHRGRRVAQVAAVKAATHRRRGRLRLHRPPRLYPTCLGPSAIGPSAMAPSTVAPEARGRRAGQASGAGPTGRVDRPAWPRMGAAAWR
jgi:hypothetical protein